MRELVEKIVRALVDAPEEVEVQETEGTNMTLLQVRVSKEDVGKVIGKKGKNINALRTIVAGAGKGKRYMVEVASENRYPPEKSGFQSDPGLHSGEEGETPPGSSQGED
jgi:predicted RNA-binding protein YlqC (UPF0109 family)